MVHVSMTVHSVTHYFIVMHVRQSSPRWCVGWFFLSSQILWRRKQSVFLTEKVSINCHLTPTSPHLIFLLPFPLPTFSPTSLLSPPLPHLSLPLSSPIFLFFPPTFFSHLPFLSIPPPYWGYVGAFYYTHIFLLFWSTSLVPRSTHWTPSLWEG